MKVNPAFPIKGSKIKELFRASPITFHAVLAYKSIEDFKRDWEGTSQEIIDNFDYIKKAKANKLIDCILFNPESSRVENFDISSYRYMDVISEDDVYAVILLSKI